MMTFPIDGKIKKCSKPSTSCIEKEDFHGFSCFQLPFIEDFQLSRGHNGGFPLTKGASGDAMLCGGSPSSESWSWAKGMGTPWLSDYRVLKDGDDIK